MATIIRTVKNLTAHAFKVSTEGIMLEPGVNVDLYTLLTDDQLLLAQPELQGLASRGSIQVIATDDDSELKASSVEGGVGDQIQLGTLIGYKDNATSFRVKGPQHADEGGADVQSYSGIFYNDAFAGSGTLKTRAIHGANLEMDLELQSPHQLRLTAVDDSQTDGQIWATSKTNLVLNLRNDAETISPKQLIIDRIDTGSTGLANTSDIVLKASSGSLYLNHGVTTGAVVLPSLTDAERAGLTTVEGMVIYNTTSHEAQVWNGSSWASL